MEIVALDTDYLVSHNLIMEGRLRGKITPRQKEILEFVYSSFKAKGFSPTLEEFNEKFGFKSNQAIIDLLNRLEEKKLIKREEGSARSIVIRPLGYEAIKKEPLVRVAGVTAAGPTIEAIEQNEWTEMPSGYRMYEDVFIVEVYGSSMIEAGINNGDVLVAQRTSEFTNRDIVVAQLYEGTTVKRFMLQDHAPTKFLKPENKKYDIILFKTDTKMQARVIGKFINENILPINPRTKSFINNERTGTDFVDIFAKTKITPTDPIKKE